MYKEKKVSVVLPTYNEKDSIRKAIQDLYATGLVDEVVVINNNAKKGTDEEVKQTPATLVYEKKQGLGWATRKGFQEATGDLIILSEPDGTYVARDIEKLLVFSDDFDVVFGTRTTRALIWKGANMGLFLKWGNWFVAKLVEVLYGTPHLSDVGCTMRLLRKSALKKIQLYFQGGHNIFNVQILLLVALKKLKFTEVPVNYKGREGGKGFTENKWRAFKLGLIMIAYLLKTRMLSWLGRYP
ncbi:glycosyltransferase family 2 protein [Candidatus Woesearchaeota archaeon]|nr:glycosyltransferase family 2 protein [Candidatus Woesearchaeota archaeon]